MNYPIFEALKAYAKQTHYSFHTPGHKKPLEKMSLPMILLKSQAWIIFCSLVV